MLSVTPGTPGSPNVSPPGLLQGLTHMLSNAGSVIWALWFPGAGTQRPSPPGPE